MDSPAATGPELSSRFIDKTPFWYGWVVLAAGTLVMMVTIPGQTIGVSVFLDSIIEDLEVNRATVSALYTVGTTLGAISLTFVGRFLDRVGPRVGASVIGLLFGGACAFLGTVQSIVMLAIGFVLIRGLGQGALGLSSTYAINLWFVKRRGLAIGIGAVGFSLGISIIPATFENLQNAHGWRTSYLILGIAVAVAVVPLALLLRKQPERYGLKPDGPVGKNASDDSDEFNMRPSEARRTSVFWLYASGTFITSGLGTGVIFHHFSILDSGGVSRAEAAVVFLPYGLSAAAFGLIGGALVDRFPHRFTLAAGQLLMAAILLSAVHLSTTATLWAYGIANGAMLGLMLAVSATVFAHEFGRGHLGEIKGTASTVSIGGSAFGPILYGVAYDLTGGYGATLAASAVLPITIALIALFAPPRSPRTEAERNAVRG